METTDTPSWSFSAATEAEDTSNGGSTLCDWYNICTRVLFGGLLVIFGVIGNSITLTVMFANRHKSSTILVLFYLAMTDLLILIVYGLMVVPTPLLLLLNQVRLANQFQLVSITYIAYVGQTINQISIFLTVIVSWQRYVSVCHPHKAKLYSHTALINRQRFDGDKVYLLLYSVILCYLTSYVIPMMALTIMTFKLIEALRNAKRKVAALSVQRKRPREELTRTLVIVVIVFMLCQSISPVRRILMWIYDPYPKAVKCGQPLFFFGPFVMLSLLMNSAANFGIYILCAKRFRAKVKKLLVRENRVIDQQGNQGVNLDASLCQNDSTNHSRF
ncbi:hypothetical protein CAPTEDRAFT_198120 [Capitella teleta]|uniref:G-protein coupled receptors family 1 profile domain-containing protein n=1 Tax=Capitella teleta TaxID=283909 RepID=X1ZYB1_CAPTE|nr:hypothetical protein CAPTEDRAFT_198120 [Capitella teleta]|eukprot:ELU04670.1 hypothetical protein CAPTEDRAFT_198120 [Capitella teleta]